MLDTRQMPDISDLGAMCRNTLDVAEILEQYACEVDMPQEESARENTERLISSIVMLTDKIREITAIASVLDGYEEPQKHGFPAPLPITPEQTAEENERRAKALHEQIDRLFFRAECIAAYQQAQKEKAAPKAGDSQC